MSFLKAEWRKLAIANYAIDETVLKKYLPARTEIDCWNNICYVSLVGFMFTNVRILGIPIPFHTRFEEVNLRFYVRHKHNNEWKRGVVFIKELVPRQAITFVANTFYKENYQTARMHHEWKAVNNELHIKYGWEMLQKPQLFTLHAENTLLDIPLGSETEFITEHYWGYTKINEYETFEYHVTHPKWQSYPVIDYNIHVDFGLVYGNDFSFLNSLKPVSVMLTEGSAITVEKKTRI